MDIHPTKILLAIDGSEDAVLATRVAASVWVTMTREVHIVHVLELGGLFTKAFVEKSRAMPDTLFGK